MFHAGPIQAKALLHEEAARYHHLYAHNFGGLAGGSWRRIQASYRDPVPCRKLLGPLSLLHVCPSRKTAACRNSSNSPSCVSNHAQMIKPLMDDGSFGPLNVGLQVSILNTHEPKKDDIQFRPKSHNCGVWYHVAICTFLPKSIHVKYKSKLGGPFYFRW